MYSKNIKQETIYRLTNGLAAHGDGNQRRHNFADQWRRGLCLYQCVNLNRKERGGSHHGEAHERDDPIRDDGGHIQEKGNSHNRHGDGTSQKQHIGILNFQLFRYDCG